MIGLPVLAVLTAGLFAGGGEAWEHIRATLLGRYTLNTAGVLALTAALILAAAVPAAWLVTMFRFPGRDLFEWGLILPLAMPGYVLAYAWSDLAGVAGPVQTGLRAVTGWGARDYWFPDITSLPGLAFVLACGLYPYVYLTARAAFVTQSVCTLEAARSLGASGARTFWAVALPAARPAIMAGLALALMEAAADFGASDLLGVPTLTAGIVRAWKSFGEPAVAARLALILVALVIALLVAERWARGRAGSQTSSRRWRHATRTPLTGLKAAGATGLCGAVFVAAFAAPAGRLVWQAAASGATIAPIGGALVNSLILAASGAVLGFGLALTIALSGRVGAPTGKLSRGAAAAGYAVPGAVLALGALAALSVLAVPLVGATAFAALIWVYAARFTAAGAEPMAAALGRAPASLGQAAHSLGASPLRRAREVDLPVALSGATAGALILFVEALKELPATLMLRPMGWETLAVRTHAYASDERFAAAAMPALLITLAGLAPVIVLSRRLARSRPGDAR